ncbi:hypothetical protein [Shewanella ulleungensis]|jgi:hypothetical protein|uniref:Porin n=1 Tax=Shewanella ulleungensis TaxID=2282699 RepID=A0ABQ2QBI1_9GAMM|nr:hypothetical protein [Shewanella ulleungensis]MCL1149133.1 hypothetical protein [Shewanella ulleungensis]GGP73359.1 hypothetical protein GCM10009410_01160 [Shewanella ulleungensis]
MKFNLKALPIAISIAMAPSIALSDEAADAKIAKLEQQVQTLQSQQNASLADKVQFNGFISGAYISSDNDAGYNNADSSANFSEDSKLGFQGTFNITDRTQAVLQLMMRGKYDWEVEAEWAYLSHRFENGVKVRGGKLRVPLFMYSDYLDVGYAQPFARPPQEVYGTIPFSSYTGAGVSYDVDYDDSTLTMQAFGGESDVKNSAVKLTNLMGANVSWTDEVWTLRAVYAQAQLDGPVVDELEVELATNVNTDAKYTVLDIDDEKGSFVGIGASYDNGEMIAITEWTRSEIDAAYPDTDSGYLTLGYRIKEFTPYVTVAYMKTQDNDERLPVSQAAAIQMIAFNAERMAYSLGLRWDAIDNVAVKFDITYADDFGDTSGGFINNSMDTTTGQFTYDDTLIYTVKFDAVF